MGEAVGAPINVFFAVGWVGHDEVELLFALAQLADSREGVLHAHFHQCLQGAGVAANKPGMAAAEFHAQGIGGLAAEAFEA